jgi:predicted transposase YbfD/YdcC
LAGAEGFTDIARFGQKKLDLLRRFLPFAHGTPSHDHLGDIFASLDAEAFRGCFVSWVGALTKAPLDVIAIDGKTSRRSGRKGGKDAIHTVSAFAARQRLVMGQTKVNEKSNEIVAIPALLDILSIEGAIVTIDAMGRQRAIAQEIIDKNADYVLALKGNQGALRDDLELFATEQKSRDFADTTIGVDQTVDGDRGRVDATREIGPKIERETRFYVTSSPPPADKLGLVVRDHWAVETALRRVMDMTFRDDECRIRTDNAPENVVTLKHMAVNLARRKKAKDSVRLALKTAAWDDDALANLIAA